MPLSASELRDHLAYSAWASQRLVHAACQLTEAELLRDFQTSERSVLGTLVHTFAGDRVWLARLQGSPRQGFSSDADRHLSVLQKEWPDVYRQWDELAAGWTDDAVAADFTYQDLRGNTWTNPVWHLAMHVVNHGTHHRGQVAGFLRSMGHTPPELDLVAFHRQK